jgi:hypothetical protein
MDDRKARVDALRAFYDARPLESAFDNDGGGLKPLPMFKGMERRAHVPSERGIRLISTIVAQMNANRLLAEKREIENDGY